MITTEDIIEFCDLTPEEIEAIAECTSEPWVPAIAHAEALLESKAGIAKISKYIKEDIRHAQMRGDFKHAQALIRIYRAFKCAHGG